MPMGKEEVKLFCILYIPVGHLLQVEKQIRDRVRGARCLFCNLNC